MLVEPHNIAADELGRYIKKRYKQGHEQPVFIAAGLDSWNYRMGDLWISLRRDLRGHHPLAYETAHFLGTSGAVKVISPIKDIYGGVTNSFRGYPVVVFPFIEHETMEEVSITESDSSQIISLLSSLHAAKVSNALPSENFELSFIQDLHSIFEYADSPPNNTGPFHITVYDLLKRDIDGVHKALSRFHVLADFCRADPKEFVLTHGEPILSNIIRLPNGELYLIDLGDLLWAPSERDWSHIQNCIKSCPDQRPAFKELYDLKWILSEIAEYATILMQDHTGTKDDIAMLDKLDYYLKCANGSQTRK